jgi:hypothetical protein
VIFILDFFSDGKIFLDHPDGSKYHHTLCSKKEEEGDLTQTSGKRRRDEDGGRNWSDAVTSQEMLAVTRIWMKQGRTLS